MPEYEKFFNALCEVSRAFNQSHDRGELLDLVVDQAIKTMDVKAACLFMTDPETDTITKAAQKGLSEAYFHAEPIHVKNNLGIIEQQGYLFSEDACHDERLHDLESKKAEGICSLLSVPVHIEKQLIGVLTLYTAEPRRFSPEEISFTTAMAEQGAMAIERARLYERIQKNIDLFMEVNNQINSSLDIKVILTALTEDVAKAFGVKAASIRLLDEEKMELVLVASYGLSEKYLDKGPITHEAGVKEALQGEPWLVSDADTDPRVQYRQEKKQEKIKSILSLPIKAKDKVIGILRLYTEVQREFHDDEIHLALALAQQGGLAIQNANFYRSYVLLFKTINGDSRFHSEGFSYRLEA